MANLVNLVQDPLFLFHDNVDDLITMSSGAKDENTVFLIENGFVDCSGNNNTVENKGVQLSDAQSKFGGKSLYFDGSSHLEIPQYNFGSNDFTIDWWEYCESMATSSAGVRFSSAYASDNTYGGLLIGYNTTLVFASANIKGANAWEICSAREMLSVTPNEWVHWAFVRNGTTFTSYRNGVQFDTVTFNGSIAYNTSYPMAIGKYHADWAPDVSPFKGYIDEFRISNVARWTENFTPPTEPYISETLTHEIESINGERPPHSKCHKSVGSTDVERMIFETAYDIQYESGHKYYVAMDLYAFKANQDYDLCFPNITPFPSLSNSNMVLEKNKKDAYGGMWQKASMIIGGTDIASGQYKLKFENINANQEHILRVTNLMCIDLTAGFGDGEEPLLAWCDKCIYLDSDGTPIINESGSGGNYISNNTNHIDFIMKQRTKRVRTRIQSLDHNDVVIGEIKGYCMGGSLDITNSDMIRRSISLDFIADSRLEINQNSPFWINKRLKIFTGIEDYRNNMYWFDHGIFIPTQPNTNMTIGGRTITIAAMDKMVLANNPVLMTTKINVGTKICDAIKGLGELYGETKFMMNNQDYSLPYDYEMSAGDDIQEAMKEITNLYMNYDLYYDTNGFLVYEKQQNRVFDAPIWEFSAEKDFTISRQTSADYMKVFNDFKVFGYYDDAKGTQPTYQVTITDDNHPFSVNNMKRTHSLVISEDNYWDVEQCKARCEFEKQQAENLINNFSITTAPIYSINDVNKVVKVTDNGNVYTCLIDSISYPLDVESPMSIACHEIFI